MVAPVQRFLLLLAYAAHVVLPLAHALHHSGSASCGGCSRAPAFRAACPESCQDPEHDHGHGDHSESFCLLVKTTAQAPVAVLPAPAGADAADAVPLGGFPSDCPPRRAASPAFTIRGPPRASVDC